MGSDKFASIEAISNKDANNPWVQTHLSLKLVEHSSRSNIKSEEKRKKELREEWERASNEKGEHYQEAAKSQKSWMKGSALLTGVTFTLPFLGFPIANLALDAHNWHRFNLFQYPLRMLTIGGRNAQQIEGMIRSASEGLGQSGSQFIQQGAQVDQLFKKQHETAKDYIVSKERQELDEQTQCLGDLNQNDRSLKERHLEIIKTLTSQVISH